MFNKSIVKVVQKSEVISEELESVTFNSIRKEYGSLSLTVSGLRPKE